jgi:nitrite reductase/ring-hydroxylating ferredoxin subunit
MSGKTGAAHAGSTERVVDLFTFCWMPRCSKMDCVGFTERKHPMGRCELCGNDYAKSFEVVLAGKSHVFDSSECAIHALAPHCAHCDCRIVGHGVEAGDTIFCSAHCAAQSGVSGLADHA